MASSSNVPQRTLFDNQVSLRYKWANYWNLPSRWVTIKDARQMGSTSANQYTVVFEDILLINTYEQIRSMSDFGQDLYQLFQEIHRANVDISSDDIAMVYWADVLTKANVNPYPSQQTQGITDDEVRAETIRQNVLTAINYFYRQVDPESVTDKYHNVSALQNFYNGWVYQWQKQLEDDVRRVQLQETINSSLTDISNAGTTLQNIARELLNPEMAIIYTDIGGTRDLLGKYAEEHPGLAALLLDLADSLSVGGTGAVINMYNPPVRDSQGNVIGPGRPLITQSPQGHKVNLQNLAYVLNNMASAATVAIGESSYHSSTSKYSPVWMQNGASVKPEDGLEIYDKIVLSRDVPFIQYNGHWDNQRFFKIFKGTSRMETDDKNPTIRPMAKGQDIIYMVIWIGEEKGGITYATSTKESFQLVKYDLAANDMVFDTPLTNVENVQSLALQRLKAALPFLQFGNGTETKVRASFDIYGYNFYDNGLLHSISIEPLFYTYLFMEETTHSYAEKKRFRLKYKDVGEKGSALSFDMSAKTTVAGVVGITHGKQVIQQQMPPGLPMVHITINKAHSRRVIEEFVTVLRVLLLYYKLMRYYFDGLYVKYVPQLSGLIQLRKQQLTSRDVQKAVSAATYGLKTGRTTDYQPEIMTLEQAAPHIFVTGYSRKAQNAYPTIVKPENVAAERQKTFFHKNAWFYKDVIPFPPRLPNDTDPRPPELWLTCNIPDKPFIGVRDNPLDNAWVENSQDPSENINKYRCLPKCYSKPQLADPSSNYMKCARGEILTKSEARTSTTDKIMLPSAEAPLVGKVKDGLQMYTQRPVTLKRVGMPRSPNSILHAIMFAIDNANYLNLNLEQREVRVREIRQYLRKINVNVAKQELYDQTEQQIADLVNNPDEFLDPALLYRVLEEYFNINIYVIRLARWNVKDDKWTIEVPRHREFHAHNFRPDLPTIIIVRNLGLKSDKVPINQPQCELLVGQLQGQPNSGIFGAEMTQHCQSLLTKALSVYDYQPIVGQLPYKLALNPYFGGNYLKNMRAKGMNPQAQFLDSFGKLRGFIIKQGNVNFTMCVQSSSPMALPIATTVINTDMAIAKNVISSPTAVDVNDDGYVVGIWANLNDIKYFYYIPVNPTTEMLTLPRGPPNPLVSDRRPVTTRVHKVERDLSMIVQLIKWMYAIYQLTEGESSQQIKEGERVDRFFNTYFEVDTMGVTDSAYYYDLRKLQRKLPRVNNTLEAVRFLHSISPSLAANDHVILYSREFAVRLAVMLKRHLRDTYGVPVKIPATLTGYYTSSEDFTQQDGVDILISQADFDSWRTNRIEVVEPLNLYTTIDVGLATSEKSYIYRDPFGKSFLVQNVNGNTIEHSYTVAKEWQDNRTNPGYNAPPTFLGNADLRGYEVSPTTRLRVTREPNNPSGPYVTLLIYEKPGDGKGFHYAAMLPLES